MEKEEKSTNKLFLKIFLKISIIVISLVIILFFYSAFFAHKVYPGVYINHKLFTGQSYSDVYNFLELQKNIFNENGIKYKYQDKEVAIEPIVTTIGDDIITQELISFDNSNTAKQVFGVGRSGNFFQNLKEQISAIIIPKKIVWKYYFDDASWKKMLQENFSQFEKAYKDPFISYDGDEIVVNDKIDGFQFDYDKLIEQTKKNINNFNFDTINLSLNDVSSLVTKDEAEKHIEDVKKILNTKELNFKYEDKSWKITDANYKNWIIFKAKSKKDIYVTFDFEKFKEYFDKYIAIDVNQEAKDARFKIVNGKVSEFQGSQDGKVVNVEKTFEQVEQNLENIINNKEKNDIELVVDITKSDIKTQSINDFGINEIIGTGESDFKGSPANRIANIKAGAKMLSGKLIAPNEEFETIQNLLPIDATSGYLQELVIKGNKTIPEYGGGLCQIGTTMFRAALQSGLDITERRNHSYRVVYYEPAGTDATIYDPKPDFKFINDTGHYILIQSRIVGTKIYFDFWGTKDGRKITITKPTIYNIVKPGPTRIIESPSLAPGAKKCTESAHNGADAYFDYKVEYSDGRETKNERFSSHYVPWQAVCLVGVSAVGSTTESGTGTISSSTENTNIIPVVSTSTNR